MQVSQKVIDDIKAVVTRVLDGDTIEVTADCLFDVQIRNLLIRLYGIDTPEVNSRVTEVREAARKAKARLVELILNKNVKLTSFKNIEAELDTDKYGRYLAVVYLNDVNVNQLMINEGLAKAYFGGKK